ncbi:MAG: hypothetical protein PHC41_04960 [Lachnospiraceae bacterium]|nr:hypothetical protein [Lachnospiraceae bacterium]MDD3615558.1 hypothetical protein [Lachnospiraceae bacterium]
MKKVFCGSIMFLTGMISIAILLAGSMANDWTVDGRLSSFWTLSNYGLLPALYIFIAVSLIGIGIAVWGIFDENKK